MTFYENVFVGGKTFSCERCNDTGDIIQLITKIRGVPKEIALKFLETKHPSAYADLKTNSKKEAYLKRSQAVQSFFEQGRTLSDSRMLTSFKGFLNYRGLDLQPLLSWHEDNLDKQFRWFNKDDYLRISKTAQLPFQWPSSTTGLLASPLYRTPGQLSGLLLVYSNPQLRTQVVILDTELQEPGYGIHPQMAIRSSPLIAVVDPAWWLHISFHIANSNEQLNPSALLFDGEQRTRAPYMLAKRPVVFWHYQLTPQIFKACIKLNAKFTSVGSSGDKLLPKVLFQHRTSQLPKEVYDQAKTWKEAIQDYAKTATPEELLTFIKACSLSYTDAHALQEVLGKHFQPYIQGGTYNECPPETVNHPVGVIEQTENGWVLLSKGQRFPATSHSFRITHFLWEQKELKANIEFYYEGDWVPVCVPSAKLYLKPYQTLVEAALSCGIPGFTALKKVQPELAMIAQKLHPPKPAKQHRVLGWDFTGAVLRTSNVELSLLSGQFRKTNRASQQPCLPLANQIPPTPAAVQTVLQHAPTTKVLSALTNQLLRLSLGHPPLMVNAAGNYATLAQQLLRDLGLFGNNPLQLLTEPLANALTPQRANTLVMKKVALWASCDRRIANWAAVHQPVLYLGENCGPIETINPAQLQKLALHLLAYAIGAFAEKDTVTNAVVAAWNKLSGKSVSALRPISQSEAVGYWLSKGITSGVLEICHRNPKKVSEISIWPARTDGYLWFAKDALNHVIKKNQLPQWDLADVSSQYVSDSLDYSSRKFQRITAWKISVDLLKPAARQQLLEPKSPAGRKRKTA